MLASNFLIDYVFLKAVRKPARDITFHFLESMDYILDSSDHLDTQSNITEHLGAFQPMGVPPCRLSH